MSKPLTITVSHELGRDKALERVRSGFDKVGGSLGPGVKMTQRWEGDTLHFDAKVIGQAASGTVEVRANDVAITLVLPALLAGVAHLIADKMKKQSTLLLEKK
jgi:Putative polyhydroxyalkanoic acid system protein (PHA_gran_rgn)